MSDVVLQTARLELRLLRAEDLDDLVALHRQVAIARFMPRPRDHAAAVERLELSDRELSRRPQ